MFSTCRQFESR